jgi:hypothetical protein
MEKKKRFCEGCWMSRKQFMPAILHIDDRDLCLVCVRAEGLNVEDGEAIPIEEVAQVDPKITDDRKQRVKLKHQPGPKFKGE